MLESSATGNPVFDYRADYRARAQTTQWILIRIGLLLVIAGIGAYCFRLLPFVRDLHLLFAIGMGLSLLLVGMHYAGRWRENLRADFQREYGPRI